MTETSKQKTSTKKKDKKDADMSFFADQKTDIQLLPSGCTLLDLVHGGGYPLGRMVNIVGDKSAGKSLLAIEAMANFKIASDKQGWKSAMWYNEAESAFDQSYASALGMPINEIYFVCESSEPKETRISDANSTIEGLFDSITKVCDYHEENKLTHGIYVIDSMDALSDRSEMKRDIDQGTYGANKAKKIGELFRRLVRRLEDNNILFIIISQVRDKIGVTFGETKTRSGGKALDFYASIITWLADIGKEKKTIQGIERPIGVNIRAKCKKNKVGLPFRECDYYLEFGYGINDLMSNIKFLVHIKDMDWLDSQVGIKKTTMKRRVRSIIEGDFDEYVKISEIVKRRVQERWKEIEMGFLPKRGKYG